MAERQILWYKYSSAEPERHNWNFLIVNEKREIAIAKQNLYEQLEPVVEERLIDKGKVFCSDLFYELFCIETPINKLDFSKVYQGKVREDRRLQPRRSINGWNNLISKIFHGDI